MIITKELSKEHERFWLVNNLQVKAKKLEDEERYCEGRFQ